MTRADGTAMVSIPYRGGRLTPWAALGKLRRRIFGEKGAEFFEQNLLLPVGDYEETDLLKIFEGHDGNVVHKWMHYFEIYERYLSRYRGTRVRLLEIGVGQGGSLQMWRRYFGEAATICGIDVSPRCAEFDGQGGQVRIGSQADTGFLESVVAEMGGIDVVIDDGSHDSAHLKVSLETLFPRLTDGGIYIAEDLHCCYWPEFSGGYWWPWSFLKQSTGLIDDMHAAYHGKAPKWPTVAGHIGAVHYYDSMIVIEKARPRRHVHQRRPNRTTADALTGGNTAAAEDRK